MANSGRRTLLKIAACSAVLLVASAAYSWWRARPRFDPDETAQHRAALEAEREELLAWACSRTPLGDALAARQTDFDALFEGPRWEACRAQAAELGREDRATNDAGHTYDWSFDRGEREELAEAAEHASYVRILGPPPPEPSIEGAEDACDGLEEAVARAASSGSLCTPFGPGRLQMRDGGLDLDMGQRVLRVAHGIGQRARRLSRERSVFAALELLIQGIALSRDVRRGPSNLLVAMISVGAERILMAHAATLLMAEPNLSSAEFHMLDDWIASTLADTPDPAPILRGERSLIPLLAAQDTAEAAGLAQAASLDLSWCSGGADAESCHAALRTLQVRAPAELPSEWSELLLGARATRDATLAWSRQELLSGYSGYLTRLRLADAQLGLLRSVLAWSDARARTSSCPPPLPEAARQLPTSDAPVEIVRLGGDEYEMRSPALRIDVDGERPVVSVMCPAARTGWFDADGQVVAEEPDSPAP